MTVYFAIKALHVLSAFLFFGTGLGSAWYKLRADRSRDLRVIAWAQREIVRADWIFTVPSGLLLPATGAAMVLRIDFPWDAPWLLWGIGGYAVAGLSWLPAAWLQLRMRALADQALRDGTVLAPAFHRYARLWVVLGVPSFGAAVLTIWVMVTKHVPSP